MPSGRVVPWVARSRSFSSATFARTASQLTVIWTEGKATGYGHKNASSQSRRFLTKCHPPAFPPPLIERDCVVRAQTIETGSAIRPSFDPHGFSAQPSPPPPPSSTPRSPLGRRSASSDWPIGTYGQHPTQHKSRHAGEGSAIISPTLVCCPPRNGLAKQLEPLRKSKSFPQPQRPGHTCAASSANRLLFSCRWCISRKRWRCASTVSTCALNCSAKSSALQQRG